jgi:hypothetical protein
MSPPARPGPLLPAAPPARDGCAPPTAVRRRETISTSATAAIEGSASLEAEVITLARSTSFSFAGGVTLERRLQF